MVSTLVTVWQSSVWCAVGGEAVLSSGSPANLGSLHFLDGADTGEGPEVGVGEAWELGLDGFQEITNDL